MNWYASAEKSGKGNYSPISSPHYKTEVPRAPIILRRPRGLRPVSRLRENVVADFLCVSNESAFEQIEGGNRRREANRIPAKGRAVRARLPVHYAGTRDDGAERHAAGNALRAAQNIRLDARIFVRPHFSRAAHAGLHFIADQHDSVLPADALQFLQEKFRRGNVAAFALNRLDDDSGNFRRVEEPLENLIFELLQDFFAAGFRPVSVRAPICVWIRNMLNAAKQRAKIFALRRLRRRQRK